MFFEPGARPASLPRDPFKAIVAPRPIGWISSVSAVGIPNLAPYSFFNAVDDDPPMVMFSSSGYKDTVANVGATGEFVVNFVSFNLREAMNTTSATVAAEINEFDLAGLTMIPGERVSVPRVGESPAALECKVVHMLRPVDLAGRETEQRVVIGQVVGIHIDPAVIRDGRFDLAAARGVARCGYMDYAVVDALFQMSRP